MSRVLVLILLVCLAPTAPLGAQGQPPLFSASQGPAPASPDAPGATIVGSALTIFLDCRTNCWSDYVKTEVSYLDYVNVREMADVHVLVTARSTAAGGTEYTLQFTGQGRFGDVDDEIVFTTISNESEENRRRQFVNKLKLGLVRYAIHTELGSELRISHPNETAAKRPSGQARSSSDPWNYWVVRARLNLAADSESSNTADRVDSSFSANRTTDAWKINLGATQDYRETEYTFSDGSKSFYVRRSVTTNASVVKSLTDHWSLGARGGWSTTTYENRESTFGTAAAVEYNLFPYADSTRQQLTFQYRVGLTANDYYEETVYGKLGETVGFHALRASFDMRKTWGSLSADLELSQYLHDSSLNRKTVSAEADLRLFRGFSLNVEASASSIHDQIYLPRGGATDEEVLVRQRQLATSFRRSLRLGFSYTFGSIFSNVVNTRIGNF